MEWKTIKINIQNIEFDTEKATLIKMPNSSKYAGYKFWHPSKLISKSITNNYSMDIRYNDNFTFKLFKNGNGKYNKYQKIKEIEIDVEDFEEAFENMNNYASKKDEKSYLIVEEPQKIDKEVKILEDLINE